MSNYIGDWICALFMLLGAVAYVIAEVLDRKYN